MDLKPRYEKELLIMPASFNRTFMELKPGKGNYMELAAAMF